MYLIANENAIPFYEKTGMKKAEDVMQYNHVEWTDFTVEQETSTIVAASLSADPYPSIAWAEQKGKGITHGKR